MTTSPAVTPLTATATPSPATLDTVWSTDASTMDRSAVEGWAAIPELPWLERAACRDLPLDQLERFFVDAGRTINADTTMMCRACPVQLDCLDHAYVNEIGSGFFGGMSPSRRKLLQHADARREVLSARSEVSAAPPSARRG